MIEEGLLSERKVSTKTQDKQVVSKRRITDHGEVYTAEREVNAMLDLVKQETERIDSRFLEPACGSGNFLMEVLNRKLNIVEARYGRSQLEFERYSVIAVSSIYGIDILKDNVVECRNRLFDVFKAKYISLYKKKTRPDCNKAIKYILERNIIWGDALTLKTIDSKPIIFSQWSSVNGSMIKRRDFAFHELIPSENFGELTLFSKAPLISDLGENVFIPEPVKDYPLIHFMRLADAEQ